MYRLCQNGLQTAILRSLRQKGVHSNPQYLRTSNLHKFGGYVTGGELPAVEIAMIDNEPPTSSDIPTAVTGSDEADDSVAVASLLRLCRNSLTSTPPNCANNMKKR